MKPKILILSGGRGDERAISLKSGKMIASVMDRKSFSVIEAELTDSLDFIFHPSKKRFSFLEGLRQLQKRRIDCVFPALHGEFGEDGKLQTILELLEIRFVGSGSVASCIAMDKGVSQALFFEAGFHVPATIVMNGVDDMTSLKKFLRKGKKYVVKPLNGGSSVGVLISDRIPLIEKHLRTELKKHRPAVVQEYLHGREFTCGVLEKGNHIPFALVPTEIRPKSAFFDYTAKYSVGGSEEITPPRLPAARIKELKELAIRAHRLFGCRGMSRSDFILAKGRLYILEINTLPGMTETSLLPQGTSAYGINFSQLLTLLIQQALRK